MITPSAIVRHLQTYLPRHTDDFSRTLTATGTVSGNTLTATTPSAHGLNVGASIIIAGDKFRNSVSTVTFAGQLATITTNFDHDVTAPQLPADPSRIVLDGFSDPDWDTSHAIVSVPNRRTIVVNVPSGAVVPSGGYLVEDRSAGLGGLHQIATVPTPTTFTVEISGFPIFPAGPVDDLNILTGVNVAATESIDRAIAAFAVSTQSPYAFVVMGDVESSKDRHTLNDLDAGFTVQDERLLRLSQQFSVVVLHKTEDNNAANVAQEAAYGDHYRAILSTLYSFKFSDPDRAIDYVTTTLGHGPGRYNTAVYAHVYEFQVPTAITFRNGFNDEPDVAFRDIDARWNVNADDMAALTAQIDLDEEPIV